MKLFLCSECNRHVKETDSSCPFCSHALGALACDTSRPVPRMSRAAVTILVAAGFAATANACASSSSYGMADAGALYDDAGDAADGG
jgi:hypothetical protein